MTQGFLDVRSNRLRIRDQLERYLDSDTPKIRGKAEVCLRVYEEFLGRGDADGA